MDKNATIFLVICIAAVALAGCTANTPPAVAGGTDTITPTTTVTTDRPPDCSAGSCGCSDGTCPMVPAPATTASDMKKPSIRLTTSPQRYTPLMSSTAGIVIEVNATGFDPAGARFAWNATYGNFLSWGPVDYTVRERGNPVINHGEKLYWTFIEKPASTHEPVVVTVMATDPATGRVMGRSTVILDWDGDFAVVVRETG